MTRQRLPTSLLHDSLVTLEQSTRDASCKMLLVPRMRAVRSECKHFSDCTDACGQSRCARARLRNCNVGVLREGAGGHDRHPWRRPAEDSPARRADTARGCVSPGATAPATRIAAASGHPMGLPTRKILPD